MSSFKSVSIGRSWTSALLVASACLDNAHAADPPSAPKHVANRREHVESAAGPSLCPVVESTYFSCPISGSRLISVCGSKGQSGEDFLQYRVGVPGGALELVYPEQPAPASGRFQFADPIFSKARLLNLRFTVARTSYVIYRYSGAFAQPGAGVASRVDGGPWRYTPCRSELDQPAFDSIHRLDIDVDSDFDSMVFPP